MSLRRPPNPAMMVHTMTARLGRGSDSPALRVLLAAVASLGIARAMAHDPQSVRAPGRRPDDAGYRPVLIPFISISKSGRPYLFCAIPNDSAFNRGRLIEELLP